MNLSGKKLKFTRGSLIVPRGSKCYSLDKLQAQIVGHKMSVADQDCSPDFWHRRLGHIIRKSLEVLVKGKHIPNLKNTQPELCTDCLVHKKHRVSFLKKIAPLKRTRGLKLVNTNVCGPIEVQTFSGARYFLTFIDHYSKKLWAYMIKSKDETLDYFQKFHVAVE